MKARPMHRWKTFVIRGAALVAAALAYHAAAVLAITLLWMPQPAWWTPPLSLVLTTLSWMHVAQGLGLAAASLPFALALRLLPLRRPVVAAFAIALASLLVQPLWQMLSTLPSMGLLARVSTALDFAKFLFVLPLLTWLLLQVRRRPPAPPPAWAVQLPSSNHYATSHEAL